MHLAEGTLPLDHGLAYTAVALPAVAWSLRGDLHAQRTNSPTNIDRVILLRESRLVFDGPRSTALSTTWLERAGLARPTARIDLPPSAPDQTDGKAP